ncbi:hypothetical protein GGP41_002514 [Bipolaris sorokiniana]|uniref:Uncharacterized protein n=1 Tax=Cochliobolus sativus TaxID=45130 RepID=A0A8H5ZK69_COCSA|nr:hypothetical protein GGP41_002514 [Bipolaris sorokiniana]
MDACTCSFAARRGGTAKTTLRLTHSAVVLDSRHHMQHTYSQFVRQRPVSNHHHHPPPCQPRITSSAIKHNFAHLNPEHTLSPKANRDFHPLPPPFSLVSSPSTNCLTIHHGPSHHLFRLCHFAYRNKNTRETDVSLPIAIAMPAYGTLLGKRHESHANQFRHAFPCRLGQWHAQLIRPATTGQPSMHSHHNLSTASRPK